MLRNFWKDEEGSVIVFTALSMIALIGFTSLVVDVGSMTNERSLLQNAADAAALAGVVQEEENQVTVAKQYVLANTTGVEEDDIIVTQLENGDLKVEIEKDSKAFFSQVLTGSNTNRVAAGAVATMKDTDIDGEYAIWAEEEISLGNKSVVEGDVHSSAGDFKYRGNDVEIIGEQTSGNRPMPDYSYMLDQSRCPETIIADEAWIRKNHKYEITSSNIARLEQEAASKNLSMDKAIFYFSGLGENTEVVVDVALRLNIICPGDITFNGQGAVVNSMILYSTHGDITTNGQGATLGMLIYAPNGDAKFNGQGLCVTGSVIAQNVTADNDTDVTFNNMGLDGATVPKPKLVE